MDSVRESWTDERLDDLKDQVMEVSRRMETRFDSVETRIDALQRTMIQFCGVVVAALIGLIASQAALAIALA